MVQYPEDFLEVMKFHGHVCPGLVSGYRLAKAALAALGLENPEQGDLVTVAETDRCTIDAFQVVLGCTVGKGKLFVENSGKQAFTVGCRRSGKAVRVVTRNEAFQYTPESNALTQKVMSGKASNEEYQVYKAAREQRVAELLSAADSEILEVQPVNMKLPEREMVFNSCQCAFCGEQMMEPWVRMKEGKIACVACARG
ncbi:MAG TPA: FmdE family protein [Patescibacteria group bacterium]|nr:FmdE family protein [Patescibacteria group bacterium]